MKESLQNCGYHNIKRSLAYWAGEISEMNDFYTIIEILNCVFNRNLIDRTDEARVHVVEHDAFEVINLKLLETGLRVDEIAIQFSKIGANELLYNLVDLILNRAKLDEIKLMIVFFQSHAEALDYLKTREYLKLLRAVLKNIDQINSEQARVEAKVDEIWD